MSSAFENISKQSLSVSVLVTPCLMEEISLLLSSVFDRPAVMRLHTLYPVFRCQDERRVKEFQWKPFKCPRDLLFSVSLIGLRAASRALNYVVKILSGAMRNSLNVAYMARFLGCAGQDTCPASRENGRRKFRSTRSLLASAPWTNEADDGKPGAAGVGSVESIAAKRREGLFRTRPHAALAARQGAPNSRLREGFCGQGHGIHTETPHL